MGRIVRYRSTKSAIAGVNLGPYLYNIHQGLYIFQGQKGERVCVCVLITRARNIEILEFLYWHAGR